MSVAYQKQCIFHCLLKYFLRILNSLIAMGDQHPEGLEDFNTKSRLRNISDHYEDLLEQLKTKADGISLLLSTVNLTALEHGENILLHGVLHTHAVVGLELSITKRQSTRTARKHFRLADRRFEPYLL